MAERRNIAVLISGGGSNLQALIDACAAPDYPARIAVVISNKEDAYGLTRAKNAGIKTAVISHKNYKNRSEYDAKITEVLEENAVEFVCLAGFMRLLSDPFVARWHNRLINIHPSLLPDFKGAHAHEDVIAAGAKLSGCTVHFVRPEMDSGPIIGQISVPVLPGDTPKTLAERVLIQEHILYPRCVRLLAEERLSIRDEKVYEI